VKGKLIQGLGACSTYRERNGFHQRLRRQGRKEVWRFKTIALEGEPGATLGSLPPCSARAPKPDHRQL